MTDTEEQIMVACRRVAEATGIALDEIEAAFGYWGDDQWAWTVRVDVKIRPQPGGRLGHRVKPFTVTADGTGATVAEAAELAIQDVAAYRRLEEA